MNDLSNDIIKIAYLTSMSEIVAYIFISNLKYKNLFLVCIIKIKRKLIFPLSLLLAGLFSLCFYFVTDNLYLTIISMVNIILRL